MRDFTNNDDRNTAVKYNLERIVLNLKIVKMLINIHNKRRRKIVEFSIISNYDSIKQLLGFSNLSFYLIKLVLNSYNIPCLN